MKAIQFTQFGDPEVLQYTHVNEPLMTEEDVLISLSAAGVNSADSYIRQGGYSFFKPKFPYTPGFDGSGIVEKVGINVTNFKVGDRVFVASCLAKQTSGTYAEKMICHKDGLRKLGDNLSFEQGAALGVPASAAFRGLFQRGKLQKGETVLIHGASGGVGTLAVQMAKSIGAYVIGTAGTLEGMTKVKASGADMVVNHHEKDYDQQIPPVDLVLEMLANVNLERDLKLIKKYGRVVIIGNRGSLDFNPRLAMEKEANILGLAVWNATEQENNDCLDGIEKMITDGIIIPEIGKTFPLEKAAQAQKESIENPVGKIILVI